MPNKILKSFKKSNHFLQACQANFLTCPSSLLRTIVRSQGFRGMSAGSIGREIASPKDSNLVSAKGGGVYHPALSRKFPAPHDAK